MKFQNDDEKRQFLCVVAKVCAELFKTSHYPRRAFDFPFHGVPDELAYPILELHIRIPSLGCLPSSLKFPAGHFPSREEYSAIFRSCPAIENIQLRPEFQRNGFLNSFMGELAALGIPYVNISNIENDEFALHFLELSQCAGSGVELTSAPNTVCPAVSYPTFSIDLRKHFGFNQPLGEMVEGRL